MKCSARRIHRAERCAYRVGKPANIASYFSYLGTVLRQRNAGADLYALRFYRLADLFLTVYDVFQLFRDRQPSRARA